MRNKINEAHESVGSIEAPEADPTEVKRKVVIPGEVIVTFLERELEERAKTLLLQDLASLKLPDVP